MSFDAIVNHLIEEARLDERNKMKKLIENGDGNKPIKLDVRWGGCDHLQDLRAFRYSIWFQKEVRKMVN